MGLMTGRRATPGHSSRSVTPEKQRENARKSQAITQRGQFAALSSKPQINQQIDVWGRYHDELRLTRTSVSCRTSLWRRRLMVGIITIELKNT